MLRAVTPMGCANAAASKTGHTSYVRRHLKMHSMYLRAESSFILTALGSTSHIIPGTGAFFSTFECGWEGGQAALKIARQPLLRIQKTRHKLAVQKLYFRLKYLHCWLEVL